jgi:hypothetical protein
MVDLGLATLSRSEIAAFLIVFRDTRQGGLARVGLSDMARRSGMSRSSASRAVRSLVRRGVLFVVKQGVPGKASLYSLLGPDDLRRLYPATANWLDSPARKENVRMDATK